MANIERALRVKGHALDRYREHHPEGDREEVELAVHYGEEVSIDMGRTLVGRPVDRAGWDNNDRYILSPDRRGMFVVRFNSVRTYLRFGAQQEAFAEKHWPTSTVVEIPEPMSRGPTPTCEDTKKGYSSLEYPLLGRPLGELRISKALRLSLGLTKAHQVQRAFARAVLADPELYWRDPPTKKPIKFTLRAKFGGRSNKDTPVLLGLMGSELLLKLRDNLRADIWLPASGYRMPEDDEDVYPAEQSAS